MLKNEKLKINHIGIAVRSIEESLKFYTEKLNLKDYSIEEVEARKVKVASLQVGDIKIELIESTSVDGPIAKFIEKRGQGIHHIAFDVHDIEKELNDLKDKNVQLINETPREGAHNTRIAFIHPKNSSGVLIELVEKAEGSRE